MLNVYTRFWASVRLVIFVSQLLIECAALRYAIYLKCCLLTFFSNSPMSLFRLEKDYF